MAGNAVRVKDASGTWIDLAYIATGPQGPKGDKGDPGSLTGPAGGDLAGNYPNPTIGDGKVTYAKLAPDATRTIVRLPAIAGNGGAIGTALTVLPGLAISYTTPAYAMQGRIDVALRIDQGAAAWTWLYVGLRITPTPVSRIAGAASDAQVALMGLHAQGNPHGALRGFDHVWLAPSTAYTFQVTANAAAGGMTWTNVAENYMLGDFWRR